MLNPLKITVPADFGIENLEYEIHNNIFLKLKNSEDFKANSMILSYNSPVFKKLFLELCQSSLIMDDFSPDVVKSFIRALYAGKMNIEKNDFRELNKLSKVFEVQWAVDRCTSFWQNELNKTNIAGALYASLKWLVEEAQYTKTVLKNGILNRLFTDRLLSDPNRMKFIEPYMHDYLMMDNSQLDFVVEATKPQPEHLLGIIRMNIEKQGYILDRVSRYLLTNIDLLRCLESSETVFEEIFDILTEKITDISGIDFKWISNIYRVTRKTFSAKCALDSSSKNDRLFQNKSVLKTSPIKQKEIHQKSECTGNPKTDSTDPEKPGSEINKSPRSITKKKKKISQQKKSNESEEPLPSTAYYVDSQNINPANVIACQSTSAVPNVIQPIIIQSSVLGSQVPVLQCPIDQLHLLNLQPSSSDNNPVSSSKTLKQPESKKQPTTTKKNVLTDNKVEIYNLKNIFGSIHRYSDMDTDNLLSCIENGPLPEVQDLYDLIEVLYLVCDLDDKPNIRDLHVKKIIDVMKLKKWTPVHPGFLDKWECKPSIANKLLNLYGGQLSSNKGNFCLQGFWGKSFNNDTITAKRLFSSDTNFHFNGSTVGMPKPCEFYLNFKGKKSYGGVFEVIFKNVNHGPAFPSSSAIHVAVIGKAVDCNYTDTQMTGMLCWRNMDGCIAKKEPDGSIEVGELWSVEPEEIFSIFVYIHV